MQQKLYTSSRSAWSAEQVPGSQGTQRNPVFEKQSKVIVYEGTWRYSSVTYLAYVTEANVGSPVL